MPGSVDEVVTAHCALCVNNSGSKSAGYRSHLQQIKEYQGVMRYYHVFLCFTCKQVTAALELVEDISRVSFFTVWDPCLILCFPFQQCMNSQNKIHGWLRKNKQTVLCVVCDSY